MTATGGHGGAGGGLNGGSGGSVTSTSSNRTGGNGNNLISNNTTVSGGAGTASHSSSDFNIPASSIANLHRSHTTQGWSSPPVGWVFETDNPTISIRMSYSISGASGTGGNAAAISHPPGPQAWLNTSNSTGSVHGQGGSALSLNAISVSGLFRPLASTRAQDQRPGMVVSSYYSNNWSWNDVPGNANQNRIDSTISLTVGANRMGINGGDGGNNRNTTTGDGAAGGSVNNSRPSNGAAGGVIIHKIY
jgi:hypothetical protein